MTASQALNTERGGRTASGAAKAPGKAAGDADRDHFVIRAYIYFIVRVKRPCGKRGQAYGSWLTAVFSNSEARKEKADSSPPSAKSAAGFGMRARGKRSNAQRKMGLPLKTKAGTDTKASGPAGNPCTPGPQSERAQVSRHTSSRDPELQAALSLSNAKEVVRFCDEIVWTQSKIAQNRRPTSMRISTIAIGRS